MSKLTIRYPFTMFGKTKNIKVVTYTDGKKDDLPKDYWSKEMWIEREEEMYGIPRKGTVRIITRDMWSDYNLEMLMQGKEPCVKNHQRSKF